MKRIIFATGNKNKIIEIKEILSDTGLVIESMSDAGFDLDIVEDADTFEGNALIKAKALWRASGELSLADDSGLEIDALGGMPGVYSSRYLGEDTPYEEKMSVILKKLEGIPDKERIARFVCVIAALLPDGRILTSRGTMEGLIAKEPAGCGGFGYDPILYIPEMGCTSAELTSTQKNRISHRGKALRKMRDMLIKEADILHN